MRVSAGLLICVACWTTPAPKQVDVTPPPPSPWAGTISRCGTIEIDTTGAEPAPSRDGTVVFDGKAYLIKRLAREGTAVVDLGATESTENVTELAVGGGRLYWSMMGYYELHSMALAGGAPKPIALPSLVHSIEGTGEGALVLTREGDLFRIVGDVPKPFLVGRKLKHVVVDNGTIYVEDGTHVFRIAPDNTLHQLAKTGGEIYAGDQFTARDGTVAWFTADGQLHILRPRAEAIAIPTTDGGLSPRIVDGIVFYTRGLNLFRVRDRVIELAISDQGEFADGMFLSFVIEDARIVIVHDDNIRLFCR